MPFSTRSGAFLAARFILAVDLIENIPGSLSRYSPRLEYLLNDEGAYEQSELESLKSLVSLLFQLEKTPLREVGHELVRRLLKWL